MGRKPTLVIPSSYREGVIPTNMNDDEPLLIGGNFSIKKELDLFTQARAANANCLQFFISDKYDWPKITIEQTFIDDFINLINIHKWAKGKVFIHGNLLMNIGSADEGIFNRSKSMLTQELAICERLSVAFYVLHPGSSKKKMSRTKTISQIARTINDALESTSTSTILLEIMAGQGDTVGASFGELKEIRDQIRLKNRIGICLDVQHMWAAGIDLTNWDKVLDDLDDCLGLENLKLIHLNDSKSGFNSRIDAHEKIGNGTIPIKILRNVINHPKTRAIPKILETSHSEDPLNVDSLRREISMIRNELYAKGNNQSEATLLIETAEFSRHFPYHSEEIPPKE